MGARERALRISGALLFVALLGAGCTDDGAGPSTTTTARPAGKVVEGGTVRLGLGAAIQPDPALVNLGSPTDLLVADLLHDGLTRLDAGGAPVPALATSWTPDATFATWVFTLDPEATFTSGRAVTSADVVASLERVARRGEASLAALDLELITGFRAFVDGTAERLAGLTAPDAATVQIVLDSPLSVLPQILASPAFGIVDAASLDAAAAPAGESADLAGLDLAGSWEIGATTEESVTLERRRGTDGYLDAVELRTFDSGDAAYAAFDSGDVDWALVPADRYDDAVEAYGDDAVAAFHAELYFGLRVASPVLANVELRKAVAAAIDPEAIVDAVYPDLADPLTTIIPAGVPGYEPGRCADCGYDPERAKAILAAAFPDGAVPTVTIDFDESPRQRDMAQLVAEELGAVGIPTTLRPKPLAEYKAFVVTGGQELFSFGWIGGYASPDAYLAPLFASAADDNLTGYGAAGVDTALALARATADPAAALVQWAAVEAQVLAEAVVVPIAQFRTQAVVGDRVEALEHAVDGTVDWARVWVSDGR